MKRVITHEDAKEFFDYLQGKSISLVGNAQSLLEKEQGELMRDRRADVLLNSLFVNHRSIRQLAESLDVVLVDIDADAVRARVPALQRLRTPQIELARVALLEHDGPPGRAAWG